MAERGYTCDRVPGNAGCKALLCFCQILQMLSERRINSEDRRERHMMDMSASSDTEGTAVPPHWPEVGRLCCVTFPSPTEC